MSTNPASTRAAYQRAAVLTASQGQLIVMLYDGACRYLAQASIAMGDRQFELAHNKLRRSEMIISHLQGSLDYENGGEIAPRSVRHLCVLYATPQSGSRRGRSRANRRGQPPAENSARRLGAGRAVVSWRETAPFERLIKMIERELELAGQGRVQELREAVAKTGAYMATLPTPAPAAARALVLRAQALRGRVTIEAQRLKENIEISQASVRTARRISRKYAQEQGNRYSTSA